MRHILVDVDGVLIDGFHVDPQKRNPWSKTLKEDLGVKPELLEEHFFKGVFKDCILGQIDVGAALSSVMSKINPSVAANDVIAYWLEKDTKINSSVLDLCRKLKDKGHGVHLATNQEHRRAQYLWENMEFRNDFHELFYAAELRVAKPDKRFFQIVLDKLETSPENVLLIDDAPANIDAARSLGIDGVLFNSIDDVLSHPFVLSSMS